MQLSTIKLPPQSAPVNRAAFDHDASLSTLGLEASRTACDSLHGMARQTCYALEYGIAT